MVVAKAVHRVVTDRVISEPGSEPKPELEPTDDLDPLHDLIEKIEYALQQGQLEKAEVLLERALRIDSQRAGLWHDLAQVHHLQGSYRESITLAKRSNTLSVGMPALQEQNWSLIAGSREALGDHAGAELAWGRAGQH